MTIQGKATVPPENTYYSKLRKKFSFALMTLIAIPLLFVSWSSSYFYQQSVLQNTKTNLSRAVKNRTDVVVLFLDQKMTLLSQLLRLYSSAELMDQARLDQIFEAITDSGIVDIGVIDMTGKHVSYSGSFREKLIDKNYADTLWFQEVVQQGSHISDIFLGFRELPHIIVAVMDPTKKFILRATINSEIFNGLLKSLQAGEKGDAFIANKKGELQTPSRFGIKTMPPDESFLLEYHDGPVVREKNDFIYVTTWIENENNVWVLLVKTQKDNVFKTFYQARNLDLLVIGILAVFLITMAYFVVSHLVRMVEEADKKRAEYNNLMIQVGKMASLGRMAAGVAHEVNNPLQIICDQAGWIKDLLLEESPETLKNYDEYSDAVDKIKLHVRRASSVTHRLLGFSRKIQDEKESVDINGLVLETISFLDKEAGLNEITIKMHPEGSLPLVTTGGARIQQVVLNILNNSLDAIEKNGTVDITTKSDGKNINIIFEDTGPGISKDVIDKIFDPFFTTKIPGKGTGLGLSISYSIIQQLGGTINVRNREDRGVIFTIILPIDILTS